MEDALLDELEGGTDASGARLSDWLWHPWYAKLWWALIPVYWLAMGEPTRPTFLNEFAESGYVTITNVIFIPITALAVLGFGFLRKAYFEGRLEPTNSIWIDPGMDMLNEISWHGPRDPNRFLDQGIHSHNHR